MSEKQTTIEDLPIGSRLLYRSKENWRTAAISKLNGETVTLTVASPTGYSYRLKRKIDAEIYFVGSLAILKPNDPKTENWKENFGCYDKRW